VHITPPLLCSLGPETCHCSELHESSQPLQIISFCLSFLSDLFLPASGSYRRLLLRLITLNDKHTIGRTPPDEGSARRIYLYLTTHNTHKRQTSMSPAGFEPAIPASKRPQTYVLNRAATGIGLHII